MKTKCGGLTKRNDQLTFRGNIRQGRHGWLRLTPAYSLHVVEEILQGVSPKDFAMDPFAGTGTTPLASACLGIPCHAVDINPFLVWLGLVKNSHYQEETANSLRRKSKIIISKLEKQKSQMNSWVPPIHQIEKWWEPDTLKALADLFAAIKESEHSSSGDADNLMRIAFCRVIIQNAHVSFGHQSMSFKKKEPSLFEKNSPKDWISSGFLDSVDAIAGSLTTENLQAEAKVFLGDARNLSDVLPRTDYSLVITSPPYPNRMSYIRELRPYMYWLGYLNNGRQAGELDWNAIGGTWGCATSLLNKWKPGSQEEIPHNKFYQIIDQIRKDHNVLGLYVHRYFEDVRTHILNLRKVLRKGARCHYIVGNSKFYNTIVPVEQIYAALFDYTGFSNVKVSKLRKRNSKKELFEFMVYAEAPGQ
jgi:DNA modification methylase